VDVTEHERLTRSARRPVDTGMQLAIRDMTDDELRHLCGAPLTSPEGNRLLVKAAVELGRRRGIRPTSRANKWGRWELLTWFTQTERIMQPDELQAALERLAA
jgi:hypothetical protein